MARGGFTGSSGLAGCRPLREGPHLRRRASLHLRKERNELPRCPTPALYRQVSGGSVDRKQQRRELRSHRSAQQTPCALKQQTFAVSSGLVAGCPLASPCRMERADTTAAALELRLAQASAHESLPSQHKLGEHRTGGLHIGEDPSASRKLQFHSCEHAHTAVIRSSRRA